MSPERAKVIEATPVGNYAFFGECANDTRFHYETFSLGIFQVVAKRSGGKRARTVFFRVKGWSGEQKAQQCAEYIVTQLNSGKYADLEDRDRARKCYRDYVNLYGKVM